MSASGPSFVLPGSRRSALTPQVVVFFKHASRGGGTPPTTAAGAPSLAFSLLELLVVIGLIAVLATVFMGENGSGGRAAALPSAQALLFNLLTTARTHALASGQSTRVLVQADAASPGQPPRFLNSLALQIQDPGGWRTLAELSLPEGVYVVPGNFSALPAGLLRDSVASGWVRGDGSALRSTALREIQLGPQAIHAGVTEQWVSIVLAPNGSTVQSGDLILAPGRLRSPGSYGLGESPVELTNAAMVRGVSLSAYGLPVLINDRASF